MPNSYIIQSVLIPKSNYTKAQAKAWILKHNFKSSFYGKPVDETTNYYRYRQAKPRRTKNTTYYVESGRDNIKYVMVSTD